MSNFQSNYLSNTARIIGFAMGGTRMYLDHMKFLIKYADLSETDRNAMLRVVDNLEMKQDIVDLWWEKRDEEGVTVGNLEAEILARKAQMEVA